MTDRSKTLEVMARAICGKNCDAPRCSCQTNKTTQKTCWEISLRGAEAALTAYESHLHASGMAVVPIAEIQFARDAVEDWAGYADDYYKKRHDFSGDLARIDAMLAAAFKKGG